MPRVRPHYGGAVADKKELMDVFLDLLPNQPKDDKTRDNFRQMLLARFNERLPHAVDRVWELPPIILKEPQGEYVALLLEARELYLAGYFYSCVAMCGIVGERLVKDAFRAAVRIEIDGQLLTPSEKAFDQFERAEVSAVIRFLRESGLLGAEPAKVAEGLVTLRGRTHRLTLCLLSSFYMMSWRAPSRCSRSSLSKTAHSFGKPEFQQGEL
jgi:hypothetical protein